MQEDIKATMLEMSGILLGGAIVFAMLWCLFAGVL